MIYQFHHQFKDGHTERKAQSRDMDDDDVREWIKKQVVEFPPPEGAINMVCNEKSEFFVKTDGKGEG